MLLIWVLIQTEPVQNFLISKVTTRLSRDLKTEVRIKHVSLTLFNRMNLDGTLVRDQKKDTLLYAGALKVRISDWFFLKKNINLNYVGLEDAVIKQNRRDSVWNYQFLINYFSSSKKDTTKKGGIVLNLRKIDFKNVTFQKNDLWVGERMKIHLESLLVDAQNIDLNKLDFKINTLEVDRPLVYIEDFKGLRPKRLAPKASAIPDTGFYFNEAGMHVQIDSLQLTGGGFILENNNHKHSALKSFDGNNIRFLHIGLSAGNLLFNKDTITAKINLSTRERSGIDIKELTTNFRMTPQIMEFKQLNLRTAHSTLHDYFSLAYRDFNEDMGDFTDKVIMSARLNHSVVSSKDISYFAPDLKDWKKVFVVTGNMHGTVANFRVKNMSMYDVGGMRVSGDLTMRGLPEIDTTIIGIENLVATTSYGQILPIVPQLKEVTSPQLKLLGEVNYRGRFHGTIHDFTTNGTINTALGTAVSNLNLRLPVKGEPEYKGTLVTNNFDLGKFIGNNTIGKVSFNGKFAGQSFELKTIKATLNGHFNNFQANNYNYANVDVNGNIQKKYFSGDLKIDDPNVSFLSNVEIDFNGAKPKFNVLGDLISLDMKKTQFTKENMTLTGLFDLNFAGDNIDNFLGYAKIFNVSLMRDSTTLNFDSLTVSASIDSNKYKVLKLENNELNAEIRGQYSILDLPTTFQSFLSNYYPAVIKKPSKVPKGQHFTMQLHTGNFDQYAHLIDSNLHGFDSTVINGGINTKDSGSFFFNMHVPLARYKQFKFVNSNIDGMGNFSKINFDGKVEKLYVGDSSIFPNTNLIISSQNNYSLVQLNTGSNNTINEINLAADVYNLSDGVRIQFRPSYFVLNDKKWNLEKEGEIIIRKNFASAQNVKFSQGFQELTVSTQKSARDTSHNNLLIRLKKVNIGDFTSLVMTSPRLEGLASGQILMINFFGNFSVADSLQLQQFRFNDDSIGLINTSGFYSGRSKDFHFSVSSPNAKYNFDADGHYDLQDSIGNPLDIAVDLHSTDISLLNPYLNTLFTNINGQASGKISIKGKPSDLRLEGEASVQKASLDVIYTKVKYYIDSARFLFTDSSINFGKFQVKDKYGNTGTASGVLYHRGFQQMKFDFNLSSKKILALDTKPADNDMFYGKAIAKVDKFSLTGAEENMKMMIKASVADSSNINVLTTTGAESSDADFIIFKKYGKEIKVAANRDSHLDLDLDLTANNMATISVILDPLTGDIIKAVGNGNLNIHVPPHGNVTMKGKYVIERGSYDFNFQTLVKKPFQFIDGANNFIEWTGDPENANLHIDAQYTAQQVSINDLINGQSGVQGEAGLNNIRGYRGDVYVIVELRGKLLKPDISFRLDFPPGSTVKSDPDFALFLSRMQSDENEMLKQVTYLIVFNSFAPYGQSGGGGNNLASAGVNTISGLVASELGNLFSTALSKITGDKGLRFELGTASYSSASIIGAGSDRLDRQSVNFKLYQSLANGNIIITFGSNLDFGLGNSSAVSIQNGNFQFLPDISVQFVLSRDRRLRAIVFNRSSLGVASGISSTSVGRQNRYGVSISYSKDFEKFFADNKNKYQQIRMRNDTLHLSKQQ